MFDYLQNVSVAILSCNRLIDLRETLDTLLSHEMSWREIVVADNASSDGTVEVLAREYPTVRVIALTENAGVAGLNAAMLSCSGEWVLTLDDDSAPVLETWKRLVFQLEQGVSFDAITCSVRHSRLEVHSEVEFRDVRPYLGLHQAGSLLSKTLLSEMGGYDKSLFLWGVELDFVARGINKGYRFGICDSAIVEHRSTPANRSSSRHAFYYTRNQLVFLRRYAPFGSRRILMKEFLADVIVYSIMHRTTVYFKAVCAAASFEGSNKELGLTENQFRQISPDLRLPFSFLG